MTLHLTNEQFEQLTKSFSKAIVIKRGIDYPQDPCMVEKDSVVTFPGPSEN